MDDVAVSGLRERVRALMPGVRRDLEALVRIPGISALGPGHPELDRSARAVAELLSGAGMPRVEVVRAPGPAGPGAPAVLAHRPGRPGAPTVLLYAHHDVQPVGDEAAWTSPPFTPTERDGRLYARGSADDKAGVMVHVAALRALADELRAGVTVFVEGEEEVGSPSFPSFLETYRDRVRAEVIVVTDSANWRAGVPALTTSLRGLLDGVVELRTLDHSVHSGFFGGPVPDAATAMIRLLATLWHPTGEVAVPGLVGAEADGPGHDEDRFRAEAGVLPGVELIGSGSLASRLWTRPVITVIGLDLPAPEAASNTLLPAVRARISVRLAPGQDPDAAWAAVEGHLRRHAPWGSRLEMRRGDGGRPFRCDVSTPAAAACLRALSVAWGVEAVQTGVGGSIPFVSDLADAFPHATVLVTGIEDPDTRAHGVDESLHLADFERACLAEALLLADLGRAPVAPA